MSIVTKDNERLYLKSWQYNAARILSELANIVKTNGGRVQPLKTAIISDRSLSYTIQEKKQKLEMLSEHLPESKNLSAALTYKEQITKEIEALESINNEPITVTHTSYIKFVLDGILYYYQVDDNPFFEFYYTKAPVQNNKIGSNINTYADCDAKEWVKDSLFKYACPEKDIKDAANFIFNMLTNAPLSRTKEFNNKDLR